MNSPQSPVVSVQALSHAYGNRVALKDLTLQIAPSQIFALLGPNGSGKSTLFKILSTLMPLQQGSVEICGISLAGNQSKIRAQLGVVFQSPSVDRMLTVKENLAQQAALFGVRGKHFADRLMLLTTQFGLADRLHDRAATLSGGLRRRVELAAAMLHQPQVLLLDEPSTGLDPAARLELWQCLRDVQQHHGVTVLLTTHLLEEAEKADCLAILDEGQLICVSTPAALRDSLGGDCLTISTAEPTVVQKTLQDALQLESQFVDGRLRLELPEGHTWIERIMSAAGDQIREISLGKPSLEDAFISLTGHRFESKVEQSPVTLPPKSRSNGSE